MTPVDLLEAAPARAPLPVGTQGPTFEDMLGTDGQRYGFSSLSDREVIVLIFSSNRCPTAKAYGERMNALQSTFGPRGVQLVAINSNDPHLYPDESYGRMVDRAKEDAYTFPYLADVGQHVAKAYGAACTFHVFVLDRTRRIRYQGRFDDSRFSERVTSHDLTDALEDVLAGRDVRVATTRPFGCSLDFV
jgi:peroxiredoxin